MELIGYIFIFLLSCVAFYFSGEIIIKSFNRIAKFLGWKEFVVSFLLMAFIGSLPNLFVGISSALHSIPELSFGEVIGGNLINVTLAIALASLFSKNGIPAKSKTINTSLIFTSIAAVLPILLIWDNVLSKIDGIILISFFFFYIFWLFSKKDRFTKVCEDEQPIQKSFLRSFKSVIKVVFCLVIFALASDMIVRSASFFAESFDLPIMTIGLFIVALGDCAPETFFAISTAKKGMGWMILGAIMGSVVSQSTLVIGIVSILHPIIITNLSPFLIARTFLFIAIFFFFVFTRTDHHITKKESVFLLFIYIFFIIFELLFN